MQTIQNEALTVTINSKGAELDSIYHRQHRLEYLWNADPAYWAKKSPVLFPIIGALKEGSYLYRNKSYQLGRHGFARESQFTATEQAADAVTFSLESDGHTLQQFPFHFRLGIRYALTGSSLGVTYSVENTGEDDMYFSVGGHPAFKVPLDGTDYNQYYLEFDKPENAGRWPLADGGLIGAAPLPFLQNSTRLPLTRELFYEDALVFKHLASGKLSLKSAAGPHGVEMDFTGFPYLGIWAAKNADFVCLEPWCGIADSVQASGQLPEKEGINHLAAGGSFSRTWTVRMF